MGYRSREVDLDDEEDVDLLRAMHVLTFADTAPMPDLDYGHWFLVYDGDREHTVAFCGIVQSSFAPGYAYFKRAGVLEAHRGKGLQRLLIRVRERKARAVGWHTIITETTDNPASANNLIRAGYLTFQPETGWGSPSSIYWRKKVLA